MAVINGNSADNLIDAADYGAMDEANEIHAMEGDDIVYGGNLADVIDGGSGCDLLNGMDGDDVLFGGAGADELRTGNGTDIAYGGTGDDEFYLDGDGSKTCYGDEGDDLFRSGLGTDLISGGTGHDTVSYALASDTGVNVNLQSGKGTDGYAEGDTYWSVEDIIGSRYGDTLIGNGVSNTIEGGAGDDVIAGGFGGDILDGGYGSDTLSYGSSRTGVTVNLADGTAYDGDAQGDSFVNFETFSEARLAMG